MIRIGCMLALLSAGAAGCRRGSADCPGSAELQGKKPPAGFVQWCARADGVKHGPWHEWNADGSPKSSGSYADGKMEGKWQTFHEDGSLKTEGLYKGGLKDGVWTQYSPKSDGGTKTRVEEHHAGSSEVKWTAFQGAGVKWAEGTMLGSRPEGPFAEYYGDGKVAVKGNYKSGQKSGDWSYFDKEGKPSSTPTGSFPQP
jgi:antitoxin component YwqK of YwqJK toxin-antitoxin module